MKKFNLLIILFVTTYLFAITPANGSLISVLGGLAYYDDQLKVTWAADADINGSDSWDNQVAWVNSLTIGGVSGWRLPNVDVNGDGTIVDCSTASATDCLDNEYGYQAFQNGVIPSAPSPFSDVQDNRYWSNTIDMSDASNAWDFNYHTGITLISNKGISRYAWAVLDGNPETVPIPSAVWLFGSGLLGLIGISRRKKESQ
jgi:hypothetical protein